MITDPYNNEHPLFKGQREYTLERAVLDTGDDSHEATAILTFRHTPTGRLRSFRFTQVGFVQGCGSVFNMRGYLPVYVATLAGRGWEGGAQIEVGDSDPGHEWFWADTIEEIA